MRRKDISLEFTNINSKLIEEAAEYRSSNKKLVRVLALAACIAVLVTAIPLALILNREGNINEDPVITEPNDNGNEVTPNVDPVKIIYCSGPNKEELKKILAGESVEIRDKSEIEGETGEFEVDASQVENIPARLYVTVEGVKLSCTFDNYVYCTKKYDWEKQPAVNIARYTIDDIDSETAYLDYSLYDERIYKLCFLETWELPRIPDKIEEKINKEIAIEKSNKVAEELFGADFFEQYKFSSCKSDKEQHITTGNKYNRYYVTAYTRYVNDFPTEQSLLVIYKSDGELLSVSCDSYKVDILDNTDIDAIKAAENEVMKFVDESSIIFKYITVLDDDKAYWFFYYRGITSWGYEDMVELYYPIG